MHLVVALFMFGFIPLCYLLVHEVELRSCIWFTGDSYGLPSYSICKISSSQMWSLTRHASEHRAVYRMFINFLLKSRYDHPCASIEDTAEEVAARRLLDVVGRREEALPCRGRRQACMTMSWRHVSSDHCDRRTGEATMSARRSARNCCIGDAYSSTTDPFRRWGVVVRREGYDDAAVVSGRCDSSGSWSVPSLVSTTFRLSNRCD